MVGSFGASSPKKTKPDRNTLLINIGVSLAASRPRIDHQAIRHSAAKGDTNMRGCSTCGGAGRAIYVANGAFARRIA